MSEKDGEKTGGKLDSTSHGFGSNSFLNGKSSINYPGKISSGQQEKKPYKNSVQVRESSDKQKQNHERQFMGVADIVRNMGYDWNKVRVDLAIWATGKYVSYKESPEGNRKQNDAIKAKILSGAEFKPELEQSISKFPTSKQEKIKQLVGTKEFPITAVDSFVSKIPNDKIEKLNSLSDERFIGFLHEELVTSNKVKEKISTKYGPNVVDTTKEQIANIVTLTKISENLENFIQRNPEFVKYKKETEAKVVQEVDNFVQQRHRVQDQIAAVQSEAKLATIPEKRAQLDAKRKELEDKSKKLEESNIGKLYSELGGSTELVKETLVVNETTKLIDKSEEYKALPPEKKEEFEQILVDVYRYNEKVSPELNEIYFPDMKVEIEQKEKKINQSNLKLSNSFYSSQNVILQSPEFNNYFKDHYINEFVGEDQKDHSYRDNLQKLYPESKKIIQASFLGMAEYAQCFDKEGNIIDEEVNKLPKEQKSLFDGKIKEKLATVDQEFNGNINTLIKEQSVETCLDTLNKCMNIKFDDGTKEDMLKNFDFSSKVNDGLIVDFVGSINGKKINLSYDMKTGSVSYQEYLFKDKETNTFKKNDPTSKLEMPFVRLPKLDDFLSASKSLDYVQDMKSFSDIDQFNASIKDKLNNQVQKNIDIKDARESFEKAMLQDMVVQEVFAFMGYGDMKKLSNIDKAQEPHLYRLYSMIYASISFYSKDELKSFRESIKTLGLQKSRISENYNNLNISKEVLDRDFDLNQERVFFDLSMNKSISKLYSKKDSEKNTYLGFFECFIKEETKPLLVIDTVKLQNYISKLNSEVNRDIDNVLNWKRNDVFKKNLGRCRDSFDVLAIEKSF